MGSADDLEAAVRTARAVTGDLLGAMTAHHMVPRLLNLHLAPEWPRPVQALYLRWQDQVNNVVRILAHQRGNNAVTDNDSETLLIRAYMLALDLAD